MIDLSVIIVSYNTRDLLIECLASVSRACGSLRAETWVIDNGSTDGSAEAASALPEVRVIRNKGNLGFARACNQGLDKARGRYLLLLNSDARIEARPLAALIGFLEQTPEAGMAGGQLIREDGSLQNSFDNAPTLCTELLNKSLLKILLPGRYPGRGSAGRAPREVETLVGACMLVRREVLDTIGPLDPGYFFFLEETDWCVRMRRGGWKIFFLPEVRIVHLQGRSAARRPAASRIEFYRSRYRFFARHRSVISRVLLRAGLMAKLVVESLWSLLACVITGFGLPRERLRLRVRLTLLAWHLRGCPAHWGLDPEAALPVRGAGRP